MKRLFLLLFFTSLLPGCAGTPSTGYQAYLDKKGIPAPTANAIPQCHGYGCKYLEVTSLNETEWQPILALFTNITDPETERQAIGKAIGAFESVIGAKTGTTADREGTYVKIGPYQKDCVDESIDTTIFLALLEQNNLLRFHDVGSIVSRFPVVGGGLGPHQTATIIEKETHKAYVVDSWFHKDGVPAEVVPYDQWFHGWRPASAPAE